MSALLWSVEAFNLVGTIAALSLQGRALQHAGVGFRSPRHPLAIGERLPGAHRLLCSQPTSEGAILVIGRERCVGTFRITPHLVDVQRRSGVPVHLAYLDAAVPQGPLRPTEPDARLATRVPRTPLAYYVDASGVIRQVGLVDTLLGLAHFTEGCPQRCLREWAWTVEEWTHRMAAQHEHAPAGVAAPALAGER